VDCRVAGCAKPAGPARQLCWSHYNRFIRYGHPLATPPKPTHKERLYRRIRRPAIGCWLVTNWRDRSRAPRTVMSDGRRVNVATVMWEYEVGPIPEGYRVESVCRVPGCVHPGHHRLVAVASRVAA
jgi:hypothetical protein